MVKEMTDHEKFFGKWTKFLGCGTNGGTVTNVNFKEDMSCDVETEFQPGAGKPSSDTKPAVLQSGSWKIDGVDIIFTPNDAGEPIKWEIQDSFGGRYGFRRVM